MNAEIIQDDVGAMLRNVRQIAGDFGKFYTPECLCKLITRLATTNRRVDSILDPACGCGALLVYAHEIIGDAFYAGQEIDINSCQLAEKNLTVNGCSRFKIVNCDTLASVGTFDEKFDCVLANPPFSVPWNPNALLFDPRFNECYAPASKADLAFVQHGLYWLKPGGTAAYILFPGALYRGGREEKIRAQLLPFVRCVISLPDKLFEKTSISTVCVLFEKEPSNAPVFFLDATDIYTKDGKRNVISDNDTEKIRAIVEKQEIIESQSALIDRVSIAANSFNLSPSSYVEKVVINDNPYAGMEIEDVIVDGENWARYSFYKQMNALAIMRQAFGLEYKQEFIDCDVEALRPASYDQFSKR